MRNIAASETVFATLFTGGDFFPARFFMPLKYYQAFTPVPTAA